MKKIIKIIILTLLGLIVLWVLFLVAGHYKTKHDISTNYNKLALPSSMQLTRSEFTGGGVDVKEHWDYTYQVQAGRNSLYNELVNNLQKSGYQIASGSCPADDSLVAYNKSNDLYLNFELHPASDYQSPSKEVTSVSVAAEKAGGEAYIDPDALKCITPGQQ